MIFRIDEKSYNEGSGARVTGRFRMACPYPKGRHAHNSNDRSLSWTSGFIEGKAEKEAAVREGRPIRRPHARRIPRQKTKGAFAPPGISASRTVRGCFSS